MMKLLALIGLPTWIVPVGAIGLVLAGLSGAYLKGRGDANANCTSAELERVVYAQATALARYRAALEASIAQREVEAAEAGRREALIQDRLREIEAETEAQKKAEADLETDLAKAIADKGQLDAIIAKLRASARTDCRASDSDVSLDRRVRRK
jgi:hypothetical protein